MNINYQSIINYHINIQHQMIVMIIMKCYSLWKFLLLTVIFSAGMLIPT